MSGISVDVKLFHEAGRRLVHKYRVYRDPWPHPALRNGRITKLVSLVNRAMVIAQLTQLRIAIPLSGHVPGEVPIDCFPKVDDRDVTKSTKLGFLCTRRPAVEGAGRPSDARNRGSADGRTEGPGPSRGIAGSAPGFRRFEWPQAEWTTDDDTNRDPGLKFVAEWSAIIAKEEGSSPPPLKQLSPILGENSHDSITVQVGTTVRKLIPRLCSTKYAPHIGTGPDEQ